MSVAQLAAAPLGEAEQVFPLPPAPEAIPTVRRRVRRVLGGWNLPADVADDVLLVVSELLTNALVHALPPATLGLWRVLVDGIGAVHVEVTDRGPAAGGRIPAPGTGDAIDPDEHGRGLGIVNALSARCGVRVLPGGTCRWAEVLAG
ncbi:ATP-binding protein [Streptomyces sp. NPDC046831]|uniref:ATP-binding protein n=1 Tax=Streptomyces sp. NPDC046831 TaxID=3154805 RepID=UPI0033D75DD4